ncbi:transcriptional regulator FtrA [Aquimonas voraii]|uniref:Transcriptional regulator, AraC family with amidase-like domain n=1 Tax=Aquimonas voraii TaxID=265719 RepID=A0A1G6WW64_9GAMM|nr:transcriptional regulator FtrA [Aquimonas voraii]SDD70044.1 transcriptional regulator, AraC family with amidase-like domain [Aquimonas voraii]
MPQTPQKPPTASKPLDPLRVVAVAYPGLCSFEFACAAEVFGLDRPEVGPTWYRFSVCATEPGPLRADYGLSLRAAPGLGALAHAGTILIPGWRGPEVPVPDALTRALRRAHARGARILSICSGAFVLAASGLLDGRRAATHWRYADALQARFPKVRVDSRVLYVDEDQVLTSAGSAAGLDLCLHLVRRDFGSRIANLVARRLVIAPHRDGGQAQFVDRPVAPRPRSVVARLQERISADLTRTWSLSALAEAAALSERSLLRRFREAAGCTPAQWLAEARVSEARRLLEHSHLQLEEVAERAGFASTETLRRQFQRRVGVSPAAYRRRFACHDAPV